jgi:hypothetical protein
MEEPFSTSSSVCCVQGGHRQERIGAADRRPLDPVLTDEALAGLRAQGAPGCLLCSIDEWEENWDA